MSFSGFDNVQRELQDFANSIAQMIGVSVGCVGSTIGQWDVCLCVRGGRGAGDQISRSSRDYDKKVA